MESSPDGSWEMADLEDSVARLMFSSRGSSPPSSSDFSGEDGVLLPKYGAAVAASGSSERVVGASEEAVAQVDQFLRDALQNPRERLSDISINNPQEEKSNTIKIVVKQSPQNKASAKGSSVAKSSTGNFAKKCRGKEGRV